MANANVDVAIVGAGPAGLSFARMLSGSGLSIALIDKRPPEEIAEPRYDGRDIAMTHLSKTMLTEMGVWQGFGATEIHPLKEATVQDGGAPYALHFERTEDAQAPLGYLVANWVIRRELYRALSECADVELLADAEVISVRSNDRSAHVTFKQECGELQHLNAKLVVAADSRFSPTRRMMGIGARMKDYGRVMIVSNMKHKLSHNNIAQERFDYGRTCAILPLSEGTSSIVVTVPAARAAELTSLSVQAFAREMKNLLGHCLGEMELVGERVSYPLVGAYADRFVARRFALIGDAAVGMHPVTAHGYNLGLRSADTLATQILKANAAQRDIGSSAVLNAYQWRHQLLARPLYDATNSIVRLFTNDRTAARLARKAAVRLGNHLPGFKRLVTHRLTQIR